jgi:hypothetical protein
LQGKRKDWEKACPSAALSTTNPTCCPYAIPGRRGGKPAFNRLSYCTAHREIYGCRTKRPTFAWGRAPMRRKTNVLLSRLPVFYAFVTHFCVLYLAYFQRLTMFVLFSKMYRQLGLSRMLTAVTNPPNPNCPYRLGLAIRSIFQSCNPQLETHSYILFDGFASRILAINSVANMHARAYLCKYLVLNLSARWSSLSDSFFFLY